MGMFEDLNYETDELEDIEQEEDKVCSSFSKIKTTGEFTVVITKAWADKSDGGAYSINLEAETEDKQILNYKGWITSGAAKGCKNYYLDKDINKKYLPDYLKVKALDYLVTKNDRTFPSTKPMEIELYDFDVKAMKKVTKEVVSEWIGKPINVLVKAVREFGSKQVGGAWVDDESKIYDKVEIQHFLDAVTRKTKNETIANTSGFVDKWLKANPSDSVIDRTGGKTIPKTENSDTTSDDCPI